MFRKYRVELKFINRLCGSVPQDKEMVKKWLDGRKPSVKPPGGRSINEINEEVIATMPDQEAENAETEKAIALGFQVEKSGLVMRGGTLKAHVKDCARILSQNYIGKIQGEKSLNVRVTNCTMIQEYWVPIMKDGKRIAEADGLFDKAVHLMGRFGPINALKRIQYVEQPTLTFHWLVMKTTTDKNVVTEDDLKSILTYGSVHGYAGERGDGEGRYEWTLEEVK